MTNCSTSSGWDQEGSPIIPSPGGGLVAPDDQDVFQEPAGCRTDEHPRPDQINPRLRQGVETRSVFYTMSGLVERFYSGNGRKSPGRPKTLMVTSPHQTMLRPGCHSHSTSPSPSMSTAPRRTPSPSVVVIATKMEPTEQNEPIFDEKVSKRLEQKRDSMTQMHRFCHSEEVFSRKKGIRKMQTLDVPAMGDNFQRQMSLGESITPPESHSPRRISLLQLTSKQKKALKASFNILNSGGNFLKITEQIFRRMESKFPDVRSIFLTTAFVNSLSRERESPPLVRTEHDHCRCLVVMFDRIIDSLDDMDREVALLRLYGEKHAQMHDSGFTGSMIEAFGELAIGIIGAQECVKYSQETIKAWRLLMAFLTDEIKVGYDRWMKREERRNSNNEMARSITCPYAK